ncbi:TetR/AcrR family transcriptional regulator [Rhodococcus sp. NPDC058514]|uniref:TetR/AcrR family transcriptional regulator n=1 Tax=unclassified Rhodococcus (in: high G+C Gram-positive bacteria) TaxID=192944 RepID=UPI00365B0B62
MTRVQPAAGRRYAGLDAGQRAAARRAAILAAALELFGTNGYAATSVKQICGAADLTERYFYESFTDRHASLKEVYVDIIDEVRRATLAALGELDLPTEELAARGLSAFVTTLTDDPRRAQIVLIEVVGVSPELEKCRHDVLREFADLIGTVWFAEVRAGVPRDFVRLTAIALVGAVNHLLVDWLLGGREQDPGDLVAVCVALFVASIGTLTSN